MKLVAFFLLSTAPIVVSGFTARLLNNSPSLFALGSRPDSSAVDVSVQELHKDEYQKLVQNLAAMMHATSNKMQLMKDMVAQLEDLEIHDPQVTKLDRMSDDLAQALAEAKAADDVFGSNSDESQKAWVEAEEVSAGKPFENTHKSYRYNSKAQNQHHSYASVVDPQSLDAALEAFGKIEHLGRLVTMESNRMERDVTP